MNFAHYSGYTWGTDYQPVDKSGKPVRYRPCPDFGIVHTGPSILNILGEVKFSSKRLSADRLLKSIRNDMDYYMALPRSTELGWHYGFGLGVAYAEELGTKVNAEIVMSDWDTRNHLVLILSNDR